MSAIATILNPPATALFNGINQIQSWEFTLTHGITPSTCQIQILPQFISPLAIDGDLVLTDWNNRLVFPNCRIDVGSFRYNKQGQVVQLTIMDRRWKWRFSKIHGHWNMRRRTGEIVPRTKTTCRDLAIACLSRMGESHYDVSKLPNSTFPEVDWYGSNAAQELSNLAQSLGCRVVYHLDDSVSLELSGRGVPLPIDGTIQSYQETTDPPDEPDVITVVCAPTRFQVDFTLEPVGINSDDSIQLLENLSYAPEPGQYLGGFHKIDFENFNYITDTKLREKAKQSVWRMFQLKGFYGDNGEAGFSVPGVQANVGGTVNGHRLVYRDQLVLEDEQVDTQPATVQPGMGIPVGSIAEVNKQAWVYGVYFDFKKGQNSVSQLVPLANNFFLNTGRAALYEKGFSVDSDRYLVLFNDPVVSRDTQNGTNYWAAPQIVLRTGFTMRNVDSNAFIHHEYPPSPSTGSPFIQPLIRNDLVLGQSLQYGSSFSLGGATLNTDNTADLNSECGFYESQAWGAYNTETPQTGTYVGLRTDVDMDGAIMQIQWRGDKEGWFTTINRNNEAIPYVLPYREKEFLRKVSNIASSSGPGALGPPGGNPVQGQFPNKPP